MGKQCSVQTGNASVRAGRAISALLMGGGMLWCALPANAADLTISTDLEAGSCTASVQPSVTLGPSGKIDPTSAVGQSWVFLGQENVNITITCSGLTGTTIPALNITPKSGTTQSGVVPGLFASTTTGFGVVISNKTGTTLAHNQLVTTADSFVDLETAGTAPKATYTLPVAVACGDTGDCVKTKVQPGPVSASFAVEFQYH